MRRRALVLLVVVLVGAVYVGIRSSNRRAPPAVVPAREPLPELPADHEPGIPEVALAQIAVLVLDNFDRSLEGCRVRVRPLPEDGGGLHEREPSFRLPAPLAETVTDQLGGAVFMLPADGSYHVSADRAGTHGPAVAWLPRPGRVVLHLSRALVIRGRVLKGEDPAAGAEVQYHLWKISGLARGVADESGRFELTAVTSRGSLRVLHEGRVYSFQTEWLPRGEKVFQLDAGVEIAGTVKDESGVPVAGAEVLVKSMELSERVKTRDDGSFRIGELPTGRYKFTVTADSFAPHLPDLRIPPALLEAGAEHFVEIVLGRGTLVRGRVVDAESGTPLPGAEILATPWWDPPIPEPVSLRADADGCFELRAAPGRPLCLAVRAPGHCLGTAFRRSTVACVPEETLDLGNIRVKRTVTMTGRILDADGAPCTRLSVTVSFGPWPDRLMRTDEEGVVRIEGLDPESFMTMSYPDPVWGVVSALIDCRGEKDFELIPPPMASLEGTVTLDGKPLAHAEVSIRVGGITASSAAIRCLALTDESGRYRIPRLTHHKYVLTVTHPQAQEYQESLGRVQPLEPRVIDVALSPGPPRRAHPPDCRSKGSCDPRTVIRCLES